MEKDKSEHNQMNKPVETYGNFYWLVFGGRKGHNFLFELQKRFRDQKEFLVQLGLEELLEEDEVHYQKSRRDNHWLLKFKSYHKNGGLKFQYTFENRAYDIWDSGVEVFELFYEDEQPKFRFRYEIDEEDGATGSYQMFYDNGQMKEEGSLSYKHSSFYRYFEDGKIKEAYSDNIFKTYDLNRELLY